MSKRLRVNPILCDAHGVCAAMLPELVSLDPWGYPIIARGPVPPGLESLARRTVTSCPALALLLEPYPSASRQCAPQDEVNAAVPARGPRPFRKVNGAGPR